MFSFIKRLLLIAALCVPWVTQAQTQITVADGTATNTYVPIYGYYCDEDQHNQVLYPASMLTNMAQSYITSMTFYQQQVAASAWGTTVTIKMMETTATSLSDLVATTGATTVWTGTVTGTTSPLTFTFTTPYIYQGGNLLVDITTTASTYSQNYWYGVSSGTSVWTYGDGFFPSSLSSADDGDVETFTPKTTFAYNASGDICFPPTNLVGTRTGSDMDFTWTDTNNTNNSWIVAWGPRGFNPDTAVYNTSTTNTTSYSLVDLDNGQYTFAVRANCGTDTSLWVTSDFNIGVDIINMATTGTNTLTTCNAIIYDDGGPTGQYSANCQSTLIIQPSTAGDWVSISGSSHTESTYDYLTIYDGAGTTGEMLWTDNGVTQLQNFGPFTSDAITVVFHSDGSVYYDGFQINVSCVPGPSCFRPSTFEVTDITPDSIYLEWVDSIGSEWLVAYGPAGFTLGSANCTYETSYSNSIEIGGLTANSNYDFYLMTICGSNEGDTSMPRMLTVHTTCSFLDTMPYIYGFEGATTGSSNTSSAFDPATCWIRLNNGTSYGGYPYISSTSTYCHTGSRGLYWYNTTTTGSYGDYQCLVLPGVNTDNNPINTLQLKFWAKASSTSYHPEFEVGVMTNPNDINSFTPLVTINVEGTTWTEYEAFLAAYQGTGRYVAIRALRPTSSWYAYVDDFTLDLLPPCPHVASVTVDSVSSDYIGVSWIPAGDESEWLVYLNGNIIGTTNDTTFDFTNLNPSSGYTISIAALCDNSDTSDLYSVTARTDCEAISVLPYNEDFETYGSGTTAFPSCWYKMGSTADRPYIHATTSYGHNNTHGLYFYAVGSGYCYGIMPPVDPTLDITTLQVAFWARQYSTSYNCDFAVGVMTNPTDATTFTPIAQVHPAGTTYEFFEVPLTTYTGTGNYIAFKAVQHPGSSTDIYMMLDDVTMELIPDCPAVSNIALDSASQNSITLTWTENGDATSWNIEYGTHGFTLGTGTTDIATSLPHTIGNLSGNTEYDFYITPTCNSGVASTAMASFRTECGPITVLPYIEGFESYPVGSSTAPAYEIPCWDRLDNAGQNHFGYVNNASAWAAGPHTGDKYIYYYLPSTTGTHCDWNITILPPIDTTIYPMNTLQLSFWVRMNSATTSSFIEVGVISNAADHTTFVPVDTVPVSGDVHTLKTSYLSSYTGTGDRIAMRFHRTTESSAHYFFVDDVTIEPMPDCPPVTDISLAGLDSNYLSVTWTENGDATAWSVEYGLHGFTLGTGTTDVVTTLPYTITGLNPNTEYDIYVTPECTSGTAATRMGTFRTANTYVGLPFSCNFEDATQNTAWTLENGTNTNKWYIGTATNNGGTKALYISDNNGTSNSYTITTSAMVYAYTDVMISTPGDYGYSFDWKAYGESTYDYIRVALVPASVTLTAATAVPSGFGTGSLPANWIALDGGSKLNLQSNWQTYSDVISLTTAGVYHLVFAWRNDGSGGTTPPAAIDNIELAQMTCPRPANITLSNLTQTSVDVAWTEPGSATTWEYQLGNSAAVVTNTASCSLNGLTANTPYTFRVRSICGQGDTSFWLEYDFRTPCGYISLPYTQDFESESTSSSSTGSAFANCWTRLNNGTSYGGYPYVSSSSSYNHTNGGTKGLYWYNTTTTGTYGDYECVVLPPVDPAVGVDSLQLSFWAKASSASYVPVFQIGVMTDPNNISTFVGVDTITISTGTTWMNVEVPLTTYTGTGKYIAVKADRPASTWTAYVDDFFLDYVPTCLAPHNLHATASTTSSITIDWTDLSTSSQWEVEYSNNGVTNTTVVSAHPYTLNNLPASTSYSIRVRAICSVGDTSYWTMAENAATECDLVSLPYVEGFENYNGTTYSSAGILPVCWDGYSNGNSAIYFPHITSSGSYCYPHSGTNVLTMTSGTADYGNTKYVVLPLFDQPMNTLSMTYWYRMENATNGSTLYVGYVTGPGYDTSFVPLKTVTSTTTITRDSISFDTVPATATNIAFKWYHTSSFYSVGIDDIEVTSSGVSCSKPVLAGETHTYNTATVNWSSNASEFEVAVKGVTEGTWPNATAVSNASTYTFTGLTPATEYQYRVRAICDATENLISDWTIGTFTTDSLPCFDPTDLHTTNVGYTSATLAWNADATQNHWTLTVWNTADTTDYDVTGNAAYTVTGLTQDNQYYAAVKAVCGNGAAESEYSDTIQFTTNNCEQVAGVTVTNITENSAVVSWQAASATSYEVDYGPVGHGQGQGTTVTVNGVTTYTITGLESETGYSVYVRALCEADAPGPWSQVQEFTTLEEHIGIDVADGMNVSIYPNPTSSTTTIALSGVNGDVAITVVDMNGRVVMSDSMSCEGDCVKTMEVSGLAQGAYFVRINGENVNMVKKLVVK